MGFNHPRRSRISFHSLLGFDANLTPPKKKRRRYFFCCLNLLIKEREKKREEGGRYFCIQLRRCLSATKLGFLDFLPFSPCLFTNLRVLVSTNILLVSHSYPLILSLLYFFIHVLVTIHTLGAFLLHMAL